MLDLLVQAATSQADAGEVTPPLTSGDQWTRERIDWLRSYHRDRRRGLNGPAGEATWAVVSDGQVIGSVRLKRTEEAGILETGVWLTRPVRAQGVGQAALRAVIQRASALGARGVRANTTVDNTAALATLQRLGFELAEPTRTGDVSALLAFPARGVVDAARSWSPDV